MHIGIIKVCHLIAYSAVCLTSDTASGSDRSLIQYSPARGNKTSQAPVGHRPEYPPTVPSAYCRSISALLHELAESRNGR